MQDSAKASVCFRSISRRINDASNVAFPVVVVFKRGKDNKFQRLIARATLTTNSNMPITATVNHKVCAFVGRETALTFEAE